MDVERIQTLVKAYGALAVGAGSTLDNTGIPIFFVVGLGVSEAMQADVPEYAMLVAALIGSVIGDLGTYAIGRYFLTKDRILLGSIGQTFKPVLNTGERVMERWGICSLVFGRFIPYVGKVIPLLAGSYQMSWLRATLSASAGSILLMGSFYLYARTAIDVVRGNASAVKTVSLIIGAVFLGLLFWANRALKRRSRAGSGDGKREGNADAF